MLRAEQVSFQYPQEGRGLRPISMEVLPGEVTLVTGPSGCGKSTLARCFMGLIPHLYHGEFYGDVWLNGYRTTDVPMWKLAEKAGMVFQNPAAQVLAPTVEDEIIFGLENLGLDPGKISLRLETALEDFNLSELRGRNPQTLSGGEQQKLILAAVLARQPEVLILDEPLSMLDTTAAGELVGYLARFASAGKTLAIFEHRQEYLEDTARLRIVDLDGHSKAAPLAEGSFRLPEAEPFAIEINQLGVELGGRTVIEGLNLSLRGGQIVAVVGRNGVGKTTLLRTLAGLQKHRGRVKIVGDGGRDRPDFGFVFQNPDLQLFNPSVKEEILYRQSGWEPDYYQSLIKALGLTVYEDTPPLLLSEGEKKRVALALALMRRPAHGVLLDEPSLGQDGGHKGILMEMMKSVAQAGQLAVMTTHDLTLASQADRLILLGDHGQVLADGPTDVVFKTDDVWERAGIVLPGWFTRGRERGMLHEDR